MSIYKKLLNAKKEIGKVSKDSTNPFFKSKYFDINSLLEHVEPILQKNGLLLLQPIESEWVKTVIYDVESSEKVSSEIHLGTFSDPQKLGSAITYYRRYTAQSLLGLQAEDDDANTASTSINKNDISKPWLNIYTDRTKKIFSNQATELGAKIKNKEITTLDQVREFYKVSKEVAPIVETWIKSAK